MHFGYHSNGEDFNRGSFKKANKSIITNKQTPKLTKIVYPIVQAYIYQKKKLTSTNFHVNPPLEPTGETLIMWNKSRVNPVGKAKLRVKNPKTQGYTDVNFTIVNNNLTCLLGTETVQEMGLDTVKNDKFIANINMSNTDLGDLGVVSLQVDSECKPRALSSRKVPFSLQDKVRQELERLVDRWVLTSSVI